MRAMESFFQTSSIHGLRYLTRPNGFIVRFIWLLTIIAFFNFAALLIRQNVQENLDDPIATTTKVIPISKFPFPTISLNHEDEPWDYIHDYNVMEQTLNNFAFICQEHRYYILNKECQVKANGVRTHFSELLPKMFDRLINKLTYNLVRFKAPLDDDLFAEKLCKTGNLRTFLSANLATGVEQNLINLFRDNFLHPKSNQEENVLKGLQSLQQLHQLPNLTCNDCFAQMANVTREKKELFLSLAMTLLLPTQGMLPLGTALRTLGPPIELMGLNREIREFFHRAGALTFASEGQANMSKADKKTFELRSVMASEKEKTFFFSIAQMFADKHGLAKFLLPVDFPGMPPILSQCFQDENIVSHCFNPGLVYSTQGVGIAMNFGEWNTLFKMEMPKRNLFYNEGESFTANGEVTLFLQNFGHRTSSNYK